MTRISGRPHLTTLILTTALVATALPATAQQQASMTPYGTSSTATSGATQSAATHQPPVYASRTYGAPVANNGSGAPIRASMQPYNAPYPQYSGTGYGYAPVPLSPGFGGNVPARPGFGYQQGVILGPGFGAQNLSLNTNQPQRYGNDGLAVLPTLPGYSSGGYYNGGTATVVGPTLLGGYYFPNYCSDGGGASTLPTVYSLYGSFPGYFYIGDNVGVTVLPSAPVYTYDGGYAPYSGPSYQVNNYNYTVNNYNASPGGDNQPTPPAPHADPAAPIAATGYDLAFADIQKAWLTGNIDLLKKHLRDNDIKIAVSIKGKYSYSIASGDFATITKDAFDKLTTTSFEFTSVRKQTNGDVTVYARHVYMPTDSPDGNSRRIFLSFTLSKHADQWYITSIDSSTTQMDDQSTGSAQSSGRIGTNNSSAAAPAST